MKLVDLLLVAAVVLLVVSAAMVSTPLAVFVAGLACVAAWHLLGDA